MLKFFRNRKVAKLVFWGLLILILPAFVLWGVGSLSSSKDKRPRFVGLIAGKGISFDEFFEALTAMRSLLVLNYFNQPKMLDTFLVNKPLLAKLAWDRLIMVKEAKLHKIMVADKEVIDYIRSHPLFTRNGKFDDALYGHILRNLGVAPRSFEETIRGNLEIQKLNAIVIKDVALADEEILKEYRKENEKFKISYLSIETSVFLSEARVDESKVKDYYEKYKNEFTLPPKEDESPGTGPQIARFEDVKASILSHLAEKEAYGLAVKYAQGIHEKLKELINKKESFEEAAAKLGLKAKESAFFSSADYVEGVGEASPLVSAAANLKPGEITAPIPVRKGAIIFRILETRPVDEEKFKKEKEEFAKRALEKKKARAIDEWFAKINLRTRLNIDLDEIDKYYR